METQADREIVLSRTFDAPRELVWKAWTDPALVAQWWGPAGFTNTIQTMDVRVGGRWEHIMHGPDGTDYPNSVVFDEVVKPERLVFTHGKTEQFGFESFQTVVTFEAVGEQTIVTLKNVFASPAEKDRQIREVGAVEGGKQTLARLAEFLQHNQK